MLNDRLADGQLPRTMEFVEVLPGRSEVLGRIDRLCETAKVVCGILSNGGRAGTHDPALLESMFLGSGRRRLVVDSRLAAGELVRQHEKGRQTEIKVYDGVLRHMLIFDARHAVVPLDEVSLDAGALVLRPPVAGPCGQFFEVLWAESRPLGDAPGHGVHLSGRQSQVADLLVAGATDHQVANRLGMSSRTVRTIVSELHDRFGTTSRMALGFRLGRVAGRA
ncbi:regulatory protein, luxR family [Amycolatopsis xylanica]|uniref:Regulatory protein, luxR family n=1 Tax=Amycolatopsis xylanica TaxID=589385 RepID=A0A1H3JLR1_9PSEU|nr:helix-turn-helix transcriptional regulator [Amycolatopsis xylanica]SDY40930.1 regulatory protein, luxR family [Amycolatopsis xylanica]